MFEVVSNLKRKQFDKLEEHIILTCL